MEILLDRVLAQVGATVRNIRSRIHDRVLLAGAAILVLLIVGVAITVRSAPVTAKSSGAEPAIFEPATTTSTTTPAVVIHVAGAVRAPGLYRLAIGSRVADAIEAAGGVDGSIDIDRVNLAAPLADGQRIFIARLGQPTPEPQTSTQGATAGVSELPNGPLELNTASQQQLESLPGIGPSTAKAILEQRRRVGRFARVEDLLEVRGIGEAKLDQFRDLIVVR